MSLFIDGNKVPYVEVSEDFARNPSRFSYKEYPRPSGGSRIRGERLDYLNLSIPVFYSRRNEQGEPLDRSWEDIKRELSDILYGASRNRFARISFDNDDNRYYLAKVVAINFSKEYDYVAEGTVDIVGEEDVFFGEEIIEEIPIGGRVIEIGGQLPVEWAIESTISSPTDSYEFWAETVEGSGRGVYVRLNYEFSAGDRIRVEYAGMKAILNESVDIRSALTLSSDFNKLSPGYVSLESSHSCRFIYDERYY